MDLKLLIEELNNLPKGYISKKNISGKIYFYWQYLENGKIKSKYLKESEVKQLREKISRRKEIEKNLRENRKTFNVRLSNNASSLTGFIMHEDKKCAEFKDGVLLSINNDIAPLYIKRTKDIATYLSHRILDLSRPNARLLLNILGIDNKKEEYVAMYSNAACIQDHYWFKPLKSKKKYDDIKFDNDLYSDVALKGKIIQFPSLGSPSPELTNIGSFEKCWKLINGKWWLYKAGNEDELFSEYFIYRLANNLKLDIALYELDNGYIRTLNFADKYDFESIYSLAGDNENFDYVFNIIFNIDKNIAKQYLKILWLDAIVYNFDRHNENFGFLRDRKNGKIISLAPNFDNNLSLLAYNKTLTQSPKDDQLINIFIKRIKNNETAFNLIKEINLPIINKQIIKKSLDETPIKKDEDKIINFIFNRYLYIKSQFNL